MTHFHRVLAAMTFSLPLLATACMGQIADPTGSAPTSEDGEGRQPDDADDPGGPGPDALEDPRGLGPVPMARLTRSEYTTSVRSLLGLEIADLTATLLPGDGNDESAFDNDTTAQAASAALVSGVALVAELTSERLLSDAAERDRVVGCTPRSVDDEACLRGFVSRFCTRAFRHPITEDDVTAMLLVDEETSLIALARDTGDFYAAVDVVVQSVLQDPRFLYRVEVGRDEHDGVIELDAFELATRLAYFLWGDMPDDALFERAGSGGLDDPADVRAEVARMLEDPRAAARTARFHAMWLGYDRPITGGTLGAAMRSESDALVTRVVFEDRARWSDVLLAGETFVDAELADHYGLGFPAMATGPAWVSYADGGRGGILSHASFLSNGGKFGDTSPTLRGKVVRERLLCQHIPPPDPSLGVNVDEPPGDEAACKEERYVVQHSVGGCAGCHSLMDPIGFGLERFDALGRYRDTEPGRPDCEISGEGSLSGIGVFNGPGELGAVLAARPELEVCLSRQLMGFTRGRVLDEASSEDRDLVTAAWDRFRGAGSQLDRLLVEIASSSAFRHRVRPE